MCRNKNLLVLQQFLLLRPLPLAIPLMIWMGCVTVHFSHRVHLAQICQMLGKLNCQFNTWTLFYLKNMKMLCRKMMVFFFFFCLQCKPSSGHAWHAGSGRYAYDGFAGIYIHTRAAGLDAGGVLSVHGQLHAVVSFLFLFALATGLSLSSLVLWLSWGLNLLELLRFIGSEYFLL